MKLSPTHKAVLEAIENNRGDTVITLAEETGYSVQGVRQSLHTLEAGGYIERKDNRQPFAYRMSTAKAKTREQLEAYNKIKERLTDPTAEDKEHWLLGLFLSKGKQHWIEVADYLDLAVEVVRELEGTGKLIPTLEDADK